MAGKSAPAAYRLLRPLPVHRLDQYTSGVFCMAMNAEARRRLISQLRAGGIQREYVAFVQGRPASPKGTWRDWAQLGRGELRQKIISQSQVKEAASEAREAVTHYEVIAEYPLLDGKSIITKLRLRLESGLKHQIRAQAAHAGLPLVGDRAYNSGRALVDFPRQALHAQLLELEHPGRQGRRMKWFSELPKDLRLLEAALHESRL